MPLQLVFVELNWASFCELIWVAMQRLARLCSSGLFYRSNAFHVNETTASKHCDKLE